jgi:hypothetical protein
MSMTKPIEALFWSIALPGFGQFLNHNYFKGTVLILLEIGINMGSNLNTIIISSFQGNPALAIEQTDYQWLMFYPCLYMFGIWDAFKDAGGGSSPYAFFPFVLSAFFGTVGLIYSSTFKISGSLLGPVWCGILFAVIGITVGVVVEKLLSRQTAAGTGGR